MMSSAPTRAGVGLSGGGARPRVPAALLPLPPASCGGEEVAAAAWLAHWPSGPGPPVEARREVRVPSCALIECSEWKPPRPLLGGKGVGSRCALDSRLPQAMPPPPPPPPPPPFSRSCSCESCCSCCCCWCSSCDCCADCCCCCACSADCGDAGCERGKMPPAGGSACSCWSCWSCWSCCSRWRISGGCCELGSPHVRLPYCGGS